MRPGPTLTIRRNGPDPNKWAEPFKVMLSRNWQPLHYAYCVAFNDYEARDGDYVKVWTLSPNETYLLRVKAGQCCCLDYGRIDVIGACPAP